VSEILGFEFVQVRLNFASMAAADRKPQARKRFIPANQFSTREL
jgi:hypothetical protein